MNIIFEKFFCFLRCWVLIDEVCTVTIFSLYVNHSLKQQAFVCCTSHFIIIIHLSLNFFIMFSFYFGIQQNLSISDDKFSNILLALSNYSFLPLSSTTMTICHWIFVSRLCVLPIRLFDNLQKFNFWIFVSETKRRTSCDWRRSVEKAAALPNHSQLQKTWA